MYRVIIVDADVNYRTIHTTGIDAVTARRICNRLNLSFAGTPSVYAYVEQIEQAGGRIAQNETK